MPKKPPKITEDDIATFQRAMEGAKRLTTNKVPLSSPNENKRLTRKPQREPEEIIHFDDAGTLPPISGEAFITYKQSAISNKNLRKLRKGQYNVEATLDLHGLYVEEAMVAVERFLQECLHKEMRVVLIIHGKGHHSSESPILKNKLNHWLRGINCVLAFSSAAPQHGSRGAMYVLLKKVSEENTFG